MPKVLSSILYLFSHCGVNDPSWSQLQYFISFLNLQLQACEASSFLDPRFVGDIIGGVKSFIINFMIRMSRVYIM